MDPAIANQDFDPPPEPTLLRRALLPALAVNAVFIAALAWSVPWHRSAGSDAGATSSADLRSMGASATAPDPSLVAALPPRAEPSLSPPMVPRSEPTPQPGSVYTGPSGALPDAPAMQRGVPAEAPAPARRAAPETKAAARSAPSPSPAPAPVVASPAAPVRVSPSFDCAKARSPSEKLICGDAELAQLDRDLGRLNVRARSLSPDPAAFRRAGDIEWKRRETECRDKACLLAWYAQRRAQLQQVVERGENTAGR